MTPTAVLIATLLVIAVAFTVFWVTAHRHRARRQRRRRARCISASASCTDFFDTLGIGSFATTTTIYRLKRLVDDRMIPGTLNVGHALPTVAQAWIYTTLVEVDFTTLALLILAASAARGSARRSSPACPSARSSAAWAWRCWSPRC